MTEKSLVRFRGRCKTYVRKACHVWGIYDNNTVNDVIREHWQELHLRQCPNDHPKPDAWYELTAQTMLKYGDKFHKTFLRKDSIDIGNTPDNYLFVDQSEPLPAQRAIVTPEELRKIFIKRHGYYSPHIERFIKQAVDQYNGEILFDDKGVKDVLWDHVRATQKDPLMMWSALHGKPPLYNSIKEMAEHLRVDRRQLDLYYDTLIKTMDRRFDILFERFSVDKITRHGKGDASGTSDYNPNDEQNFECEF